jgi:ribosomal protein S18 acetylase RimI-like enzyme
VIGPYVIEPLASSHNRRAFACGARALDRYFRENVTQDIRRRISNCFVGIDAAGVIAGYYTLASISLPLIDLPAEETRRLPRYPLLPAALIGRLAVSEQCRKQGLGVALILDAVSRIARSDQAAFALIVDAKDDAAIRFYVHIGFQPFIGRPLTLYLPVAEAIRHGGTTGIGMKSPANPALAKPARVVAGSCLGGYEWMSAAACLGCLVRRPASRRLRHPSIQFLEGRPEGRLRRHQFSNPDLPTMLAHAPHFRGLIAFGMWDAGRQQLGKRPKRRLLSSRVPRNLNFSILVDTKSDQPGGSLFHSDNQEVAYRERDP